MSDYAESEPSVHTPATPSLAEAIETAKDALRYHDGRMGKRLRRLKGEEPLPDDECDTGVIHIPEEIRMQDPFPRELAPQRRTG
jgi:hypothetical protein